MNFLVRFGLVPAVALLAVMLLIPVETFSAGQQQPGGLTLPLRLTAWAVSMGTVGTGRNAVVQIRITRWTTPEERKQLLSTVVERDQDALLRALQRLPSHGRINVPGHTGPDPHQLVLGWDLHYAWNVPDKDGGQRIVLATDRYMSFLETRNNPRTTDYPFTLLDLRLKKDGEGIGKASLATKISFDKEKNIMELENYSSEPVRLQQVKIEN
jgi:hypothetical protein